MTTDTTPRVAANWLDLAGEHTGRDLDRALLRRIAGKDRPSRQTIIGSQVHAAIAARRFGSPERPTVGPLATDPQIIHRLTDYQDRGGIEISAQALLPRSNPIRDAFDRPRPAEPPLALLVGRADLVHRDGYVVDYKTADVHAPAADHADRAEGRQLDAYRYLFDWQPIRVVVLLIDYPRRRLERIIEAHPATDSPLESFDRLLDSVGRLVASIDRMIRSGDLELQPTGRPKPTKQLPLPFDGAA